MPIESRAPDAGPLASAAGSDYWLTGARLVDGTGREPLDHADVHVLDGVIRTIGVAPAGASTVDLAGLTLTPGLIDAHVHMGLASNISAQFGHQLSVAEIAADMFANAAATLDAGFTTVRDTGGIDAGLPRAIASGKVSGPRIIQCGPVQCQTGGHGHLAPEWEPTALWAQHHVPGLCSLALLSDGPAEVRKNVRESFRRGAEFIKLCVSGGVVSTHDDITDSQFTEEEIAAAVSEATARSTYVTVHSHNNRGIHNAVRAGVKCVEHGSQIDEETAALMARHGVAHVPTFTVVERLLLDAEAAGLPSSISIRAQRVRQGQLKALHVSRAAGVRVGLGSDLIGPDQSARGEELVLRARAESPMDALVAATKVNAQILRVDREVGTAEEGKAADLVAWRRDPLADPTVFAEPTGPAVVIQAGRIVKDTR